VSSVPQPIGTMPGMRFQFSLATLLVCMTVLGAVAGACLMIDVRLVKHHLAMTPGGSEVEHFELIRSKPNAGQAALRMAWSEPLAIAATLAVLWAIRHLKSRRENGPPVG
jgi:hypothetical protein